MPFPISPDLYRRYRDEVLSLTNARQRYEPGKDIRGLTDEEIAAKLGITAAEATEIRCIAELDLVESGRFFEADEWKEGRFDQRARTCRAVKSLRAEDRRARIRGGETVVEGPPARAEAGPGSTVSRSSSDAQCKSIVLTCGNRRMLSGTCAGEPAVGPVGCV